MLQVRVRQGPQVDVHCVRHNACAPAIESEAVSIDIKSVQPDDSDLHWGTASIACEVYLYIQTSHVSYCWLDMPQLLPQVWAFATPRSTPRSTQGKLNLGHV